MVSIILSDAQEEVAVSAIKKPIRPTWLSSYFRTSGGGCPVHLSLSAEEIVF
ncbi:MAG: hypothetical protein ACLS5G_01460 [Streptococcus sp.]